MQQMQTKTERIQAHLKDVLDDGKEHSTKELVSYVDEKLRENGEFVFQINTYVNAALHILTKSGDYAKTAYGVYQKGGIPYLSSKNNEETLGKKDFQSVMVSARAYIVKVAELFAQKPPFTDMEINEEGTYWAIKKHSLDVINSIRENIDRVLQISEENNSRGNNAVMRKYFKELLSDGQPHRMKEIQDYVFSKMIENGEYNGERSSAYLHNAISTIVDDYGSYQKVSRGVYQMTPNSRPEEQNSVYSMDDVENLLNRGFNLSSEGVKNIIIVEATKISDEAAKIEMINLATEIDKGVETSIDNISYLIAFAEDYMDSRESQEQDEGIIMGGM